MQGQEQRDYIITWVVLIVGSIFGGTSVAAITSRSYMGTFLVSLFWGLTIGFSFGVSWVYLT